MTMLQWDLNYWAILVAAVLSLVLGGIWYSPFLFGKKWMHYMGWSHENMEHHKKGATKGYVWSFIGSLVTAFILAQFIEFSGGTDVKEGLEIAFWLWLGFHAPAMSGAYLWEGKPFGLYLINAGFHLVSVLVMSALLTAWI